MKKLITLFLFQMILTVNAQASTNDDSQIRLAKAFKALPTDAQRDFARSHLGCGIADAEMTLVSATETAFLEKALKEAQEAASLALIHGSGSASSTDISGRSSETEGDEALAKILQEEINGGGGTGGAGFSATPSTSGDDEASLALVRQIQEEDKKAREGTEGEFAASAYRAAEEERRSSGTGRMSAPALSVSGEDREALEAARKIIGSTAQDTDVYAFNSLFGAGIINTVSALANRVIAENGLVLPSLGELKILTDNVEAKAILGGANIGGSDTESGGISINAETEVRRAYALAAYVDMQGKSHRFADDSDTEVAANFTGLLFHKLGENVATRGGCTAGIRGRATEVIIRCLLELAK
jgi:hypothetical protein